MVSNLLLMEFSFKVEPVMKSEMCHPMNRGILNCGSTESISWTLTYNLKYLPLLLTFDLEYNYLIWCSAALRVRMASGRSLCFKMHSNIYRVAGDESMYCRVIVIKFLSKGNSTRKVSKVLFHSKIRSFPLHLIQRTNSEWPRLTTRSCGQP